MKQQGYRWTVQANSTVRLRTADGAVRMSFQLMKHEGLTVLAIRILRGGTLAVLDFLSLCFARIVSLNNIE